jgi:membrane dipeptidase
MLHQDAIVIEGSSFYCEGYSEHLHKAGVTALNLTVPDVDDDEGGAVRRIGAYYQLIRQDPKLQLVETVEDIYQAKRAGDVGIIFFFQNARPLAYTVAMAEVFFRLGTRVVQLAYNDRNFAADGCDTGADAGLSREGRALVRELGRVGIVLDLAHTGDRSCLDALECYEKTPIISHANPRSRCPVPRNVPDSLIREVANRGGVIGLTPYPGMTWRGGETLPSLEDFLDNVDFVVDLVGVDHVAFATDTEATPGAYPRDVLRRMRVRFPTAMGGYFQRFQGDPRARVLDGFVDMSDFPVITQGLMDRGYDEQAIRKMLGLNFLRVFAAVWPQQPKDVVHG